MLSRRLHNLVFLLSNSANLLGVSTPDVFGLGRTLWAKRSGKGRELKSSSCSAMIRIGLTLLKFRNAKASMANISRVQAKLQEKSLKSRSMASCTRLIAPRILQHHILLESRPDGHRFVQRVVYSVLVPKVIVLVSNRQHSELPQSLSDATRGDVVPPEC